MLGLVAGAILGSAAIGSSSASKASKSQSAASQASIEEQRRQFDAIQELLAPYVEAGTGAIGAQQDLLGLGGPEAQQQAIQQLEQSPQFQALVTQGEESLLQNAAATGGLRGGNLKAALAQYRPQVLSQLIESQYGRLGQVAGLGQAAAAGKAAAGNKSGNSISNLLTQQGQAKAGAQLAKGQAFGQAVQSFGNLAALKAMGAF